MMVPGLSGVLVIGQGTREIFTGGDRTYRTNYETRAVPELKILTPLDSGYAFSGVLKETLRNIKSGDYRRPHIEVPSAPNFDQSMDFEEVLSVPNFGNVTIESTPDYETAMKK